MTFRIQSPGLQTTIQAAPRTGFRHIGVPTSGPMDSLSHALANRLVGNIPSAPALEITLGGFRAVARTSCIAACTGAMATITVDGDAIDAHSAFELHAGQILSVDYPGAGCRTYLAIGGGFDGENWLGSASTYLPGGVGGLSGRALKQGDEIFSLSSSIRQTAGFRTPAQCRPPMTTSWALRAVPGPDATEATSEVIFGSSFELTNRTSRMGGALSGPSIPLSGHGALPSAAVFPGSIQCPEDGRPFLLMADAQTTGGYPVIAQIIRADRHLMGQIRPGDKVRFIPVEADAAAQILKAKSALFANWLGDAFHLW